MSNSVDTFVGSSGDTLQAHVPESGGPWIKHPGSLTDAVLTGLTPGTVRPATATLALYITTGVPTSADYTVQAPLTYVGGTLGNFQSAVIGRCDPAASTYYFFGILDSRYSLYKFVAGAGVGLWQASTTGITAGQTKTFALEMVGTTLTCLVDGSVVHTQTDESITAAGRPGLYLYSPDAPGDNTGLQLGAFEAADYVPPLIVPITDDNVFLSPGNWYVDVAGPYAQTVNNGAYLLSGFTGTSATLNLDLSPLAAIGDPANWPAIAYSVDNGPITVSQLAPGVGAITLATGLAAGTHSLFVIAKSHVLGFATWTAPNNAIRITGLTLDAGAATVAPTLRPLRMLAFGDSLTDGLRMFSAGDTVNDTDAAQGWAQVAADALRAEVGVIGFGGTGWQVGYNNVPQFFNEGSPTNQSWDKYFAGASRLVNGLFSPMPDLIVTMHGTNDPSNAANAAAVQLWLAACRNAAPNSWIFICVPPNGRARSAITSGVAAYLAAHPGDAKAKVIDLGPSWQPGIDTFAASDSTTDGLHWRAPFHARVGAGIAAAVSEEMNASTPPPAIEGQVAVLAVGPTLRLRASSGTNVDIQIENEAGEVWNGDAYVPFVVADRGSYATAMPENPAGSGRYICQFPDTSPAGSYTWTAHVGDTPIGAGGSYWDGSTLGNSNIAPNGLDLAIVEPAVDAGTPITATKALRLAAAAAAAQITGAGTDQVSISAAGNPTVRRIEATVDQEGNRSSVALNLD